VTAEPYLFTGFPGFIGARLLPRLAALAPRRKFVCLVQEKFENTAHAAIEAMAAAHPETRGRITTLVGDIARPRLGLAAGDAQALAANLRGAYHLAAVYDLAVPRDVAQAVNVDGTKHVLELLAAAKELEALHYVSTAYVSGSAKGVFREVDLDVSQSFKNHYEETKFEAEVEVVRSGLPAVVYRPGVVVGDSRSGETAKFDGPYFVLSAMMRLPSPGLFPRVGLGRHAVNVVPVDFVVEALARLSTRGGNNGVTYHLTDPAPLHVGPMIALFARALGKRFAQVPVPLAFAKALFAPKAVQSFFGLPTQAIDYFAHPCTYDATQATRDLSPFGVACPQLADYAATLVRFFLEQRGRVGAAPMA
jgi:thioester reductase-like protein